jgi:hypothetical protein
LYRRLCQTVRDTRAVEVTITPMTAIAAILTFSRRFLTADVILIQLLFHVLTFSMRPDNTVRAATAEEMQRLRRTGFKDTPILFEPCRF